MSDVAEPVYFGRSDRPLFGWIHRPSGDREWPVGVVICNPFGYEAVCAHRSLRHFARLAAGAGLPAIRFDYDGVGDSAGSEFDPGRVDAWVASVSEAMATLGRRTRVRRFILVGLRLGAALATMAAVGRNDIAGVVAIAPVISGRTFLREAIALQSAHAGTGDARGAAVDDGLREVLGVPITPETWDALGRIDLLGLPNAPATDVLVLDRLTLGKAAPWVQRLRDGGADVEDHRVAGYEEMVLDSHEAQLPNDMLRIAGDWMTRLAERDAHSSGAVAADAVSAAPVVGPAPEAEFPPAADREVPVVERAVWLDQNRRMFGILAECAGDSDAPERKCVLLINNGAVHHVGPSRLHVALARRWAAQGHAVMRVDLPGIGDSQPYDGEPENVVYSDRAVDAVGTAVRWLRGRHPDWPCHAMGICSGGYHALKAAVAGVPLDGMVVINPLTFFWKPGMSLDYQPFQLENDASRYRRSLLNPESWKKLLRGRVQIMPFVQVVVRRTASVMRLRVRNIRRELGLRVDDDLGQELAGLACRGLRLSFVFADTDPGLGLLRQHAGWTLGRLVRRGQVQVQVIQNANHSFTHRVARGELIRVLSRYVDAPGPGTLEVERGRQ
ncbi:MAG: alpha/beta hydrolase [Steroidobacteraceae bacterium]